MALTSSNQTVDAEINKAFASDRERNAKLTALGEKFGFSEDAKEFIADGKSIEDFQSHILSKSPDDLREVLATKNPADQAKESSAAIAQIKERRKNQFSA